MKRINKYQKDRSRTPSPRKTYHNATWEEESGFLSFITGVRAEAKKFAETLGFELDTDLPQPRTIDGDPGMPRALGFIVTRRNALLPGRTYCLYSLIKGRALHGYIGLYTGENIRTLRELTPITEYKKGLTVLYDWLMGLLKASCDKI